LKLLIQCLKFRKKKELNTDQSVLKRVEKFPYFTHAVKSYYYNYVDTVAEKCKRKCKDEFYSTRLIHWELTNLSNYGKNSKDAEKDVAELANDLFTSNKNRISKNILLKIYNFFLIPMQTELWTEIQGQIASLSSEQLRELFEVDVTVRKLEDTKKDMEGILDQFSKQEDNFLDYADKFSGHFPLEI